MNLFELIYPQNRIVSIVGTAKNAGKTVTLNEIIAQADGKGIVLGLISTGRDGERRDVLTDTEKPAIFVRKGTVITTVESVIDSGDRKERAGVEILSVTGYNTPMGRVVLGRVMSDGYVEISGPRSAATIKHMCDEMLAFGAQLILIDGSLDRRASAAPYVSDGTILATGASLARSMDAVLEKTAHIVRTYSVPKLEEGYLGDIVLDIIDNGRTALVDADGSVRYIETPTSLQCGELISENLSEATEYVVLSGSATADSIKTILLNKRSAFKIVVKDATRIFIPSSEMLHLQKLGMDMRVADRVNIIAVTINPYSPEGYYFEPSEFLRRIRREIPSVPAFDVVQGG
ncbi:MAG: hypothetical protein ACOZCL_00915 [Bacillota bacterium]